MSRRIHPPAGRIVERATGYGWCRASDRVTNGRELVGYMYREDPTEDNDSGWRFLAHDSDRAVAPSPRGRFDVNLIANFDPNIIPYLDAPVGTAYRWSDERDAYVESEDWDA